MKKQLSYMNCSNLEDINKHINQLEKLNRRLFNVETVIDRVSAYHTTITFVIWYWENVDDNFHEEG